MVNGNSDQNKKRKRKYNYVDEDNRDDLDWSWGIDKSDWFRDALDVNHTSYNEQNFNNGIEEEMHQGLALNTDA